MALPYAGPQVFQNVATSLDPFTGRQDYLGLLWSHYQRTRVGHASVVMVVGEPGIGKTHLLAHLARRAAQEGAIILQGLASDIEGMPPYLPFLEALGHYIRTAPLDQLREQTIFAPETLTSILPELATRLGTLPTAVPLPPERQRLRLYESVGAFLEAISMVQPVLLLLDDLHLADTESLALLCYIMRHHPKARLLVLGTARQGEHQQRLAFVRAVTDITRQRRLTTLKMQPLSLLDIEALALEYLGGSVAPAVTLLLHTQSEGNPLFAEELLHCWVETRAIAQEGGQWILGVSAHSRLPSGVISTLRQELERLGAETIDQLRVAAIIGRTFSASLLSTVEEQEVEIVEERLQEAVRACLLVSDRAGSFKFSHEAIRQYLYNEVTASRRLRLHGRIAQALEAPGYQSQKRRGKPLSTMAYHFTSSGDEARGLQYFQRATAQALRNYISQEFEILVRMPLQCSTVGEHLTDIFLPGTGHRPYATELPEDSLRVWTSADTWLALIGELEMAASLAEELELPEWQRDVLLAVQGALDHALALVEKHPSHEEIHRLAGLVAPFVSAIRYQPTSHLYAHRLLDLAHRLAESSTLSGINPLSQENLFYASSIATARLNSLEHILAVIETCGELEKSSERWVYLAGVYYWKAEIRQSSEVAQQKATCEESLQRPEQLCTAYSWLGLLFAAQGAWAKAEQALEQAQSFTTATTRPTLKGLLHGVRGHLAFQREDQNGVKQSLEDLLADFPNQAEIGFFGVPLLGMGTSGEVVLSREKLQELLTTLPQGTLPTLPILLSLAQMATTLGDQENARALYLSLRSFQGYHWWVLVDRLLGVLATCCGDWEAAARHFAEAEALARREGLLPELVRTLIGWADLEQARGSADDTSQVTSYLEEALVLSEKLALHKTARELRARLGVLVPQPDQTKAALLPAGLTQREVGVLRLVAEGKSNSQIASTLCLSEKTVANHLTTIFHKTISENRAAAAAFAIRHGLV
jgi:DNA-binding CsgD family transcriptional regulator